MVEVVLADQLGILRAASGHAVTDIEDDQSITPVREIGETVFHLQVVQITPAGHRAVLGFHADGGGILRLPARDFFRMFHILKINHAHRARGIVGEIHVVTIDVGAVHAAADRRGVFGKNFQMRRVGGVEENDSVFAVGRSFAGEYSDFFVRSGADVVNQAGVYFESVEKLGIGGIGDVVDENFIRDGAEVGVVSDNPLFRHLQIRHGSVGYNFHIAFHIA